MRHREPDNISDPADAGSVDAGIIGAATVSFLARALR